MILAQDFFSDVSLHLVAGTEVSSEVSTGMKDLFPGSLVGVGRIWFLMGGQTESFSSPVTVDLRWFFVFSCRAAHDMVAAA